MILVAQDWLKFLSIVEAIFVLALMIALFITTTLLVKAREITAVIQKNEGSFRESIAKRLQYKENEADAILNTVISAVVIIDSDGFVTRWSDAATKIFGYTWEEMRGQLLERIMPEKYRDAHTLALKSLSGDRTSKKLGHTIPLQGLRKTGEVFPMELNLSSFQTDKVHYVGVIRDLSEIHDAQKKVEQLEDVIINGNEIQRETIVSPVIINPTIIDHTSGKQNE